VYNRYILAQEELREKIIVEDFLPEKIETVGGVDQAFISEDNKVVSCAIVLAYPSMELIEERFSLMGVDFPYVPGLLAYREGPSVLAAYGKLENKPDVLLIDGQGIAHPRGVGIASHIGVVLDKPTIGVAKKRLVGEYTVPGKAGECSRLTYNGKLIGFVLKTKEGCRPLFISPGHKVSPEKALGIVSSCIRGHKLPEPVRIAHTRVDACKTDL